jgi:hypothetical protein
MSATLALALALSAGAPAQANGLELRNARFTQSVLGPARPDNKFLPGDLAVLSFDAVGLKAFPDTSRVRYALGIELSKKGSTRPEFSRAGADHETVLALGGTRLSLNAVATVGMDTPPGQYVMKVTLTDRVGKGTVSVQRPFEVLPTQLGFVRVGLSYNAEQAAPPVSVPGQTLFLNFGLVGFARDKKTGHPDMSCELRVLDAKGKPTTPRPFRGDVRKVKEGFERFIPFDPISFQTHRSGKFRIAMKVTDNITKKTAEHTLDLTVLANK